MMTPRKNMSRGNALYILLAILLCSMMCADASRAQAVESLSGVKRVYVGSLGEGRGAAAMRERLAQRLHTIHALQVVASVNDADAVLKGDGHIWTSGYQAVGARPTSASRVAVFDGFLSVELQNKSGVTLWSYLVSPSKYSVKRITSDLADQLVERLQHALAHPTPETRIAAAGADAGAASGNAAVAIRGAGATFPWPLYQKWFESFAAKQPNTRISYEPAGSENGAKLLSEGSVDFAGSDKPLSDEQMSQWNFKVQHFAAAMGAVVPIYNLPNVNRALNFTPEILAGIYLGRINKWNDPAIRSVNPGAALPDRSIVVVHRSDGSGTTFVWTDYLAKVSTAWRDSRGAASTSIQWPVGLGAAGSEGVATMVRERADSIGYVELTYAIQNELTYGAVRNAAGAFVRAGLDSVTAAAADLSGTPNAPVSGDFRWSITNATGKSAYPIATFTWLLLPTGEAGPKRAAEIEFLRWALTAGQKQAAGLGYAPLPAGVASQELRALDGLK